MSKGLRWISWKFFEEENVQIKICDFKMKNPWTISSIYELQYFNCLSCSYKNKSKQNFVDHAYECHPESIGGEFWFHEF